MAHQPGAPTQELAPDLERAGDLPVGAQLGWRLRVLIASGELGPGDRLPGVRELASGTGVNVNTARAVYRRLEEEGLIVSRHGLGTFVAEGAPASPDLERLAAEAAESARASGVDPRDLARAIYAGSVPSAAPVATSGQLPAEPPQAEPLAADGDERLGRRELRRQIARLEAQLAPYPESSKARRAHPPAASPQGARRRHGGAGGDPGRADGAAEASPRGGGAPRRAQQRARVRLEEMVSDPAAHKWEKVSKQDLGEPGCANVEVQPRWGPVGALMNWWRVKVSSGCPLAEQQTACRRPIEGGESGPIRCR